MFAENSKIDALSIDCLAINAGNVKEFIHTIVSIENCVIIFPEPEGSYRFTIDDLELMIKLGLGIIKIESTSLKVTRDTSELLKFAELIRYMDYLHEFRISFQHFDSIDLPTMNLLIDLPIKYITSCHFLFEKENIREIVNTLSKIETLVDFRFIQNYENKFKLTPEEFELFEDVPLTLVSLEQLDLSTDNLLHFRNIMRENMKIEFIIWNEDNFQDVDFEFSIKSFGPGNIYKYI